MNHEDIIKKIIDIIIPDSYIGVHGIYKFHNISLNIQNILQHGLYHNYAGGLNSNTTLLGEIGDFDFNKVLQYNRTSDENGFCYTAVIAIPKIITDINGEQFFIGPFEDIYLGNHEDRINYVCKHPFNAWVNHKKCTLSQFIVGVYIKKEDGQYVDFILNDNYLGLKSENERRIFFEGVKEELIRWGLRNLKDTDSRFNDNSFYMQNFFEYLNSNKTKKIR